jgi:hypothetical protein
MSMNKTRFSLFYLGSYLVLIGLGLLFAPHGTLKILQSNGSYGDVFPRVAGMLLLGAISHDAVQARVLYRLLCRLLRDDS